jgi:hypothetical protein
VHNETNLRLFAEARGDRDADELKVDFDKIRSDLPFAVDLPR